MRSIVLWCYFQWLWRRDRMYEFIASLL